MRTYATPEQIERWLTAVRLHDAEGLSYRLTAAKLGCSLRRATVMVMRGRKYLLCESLKRKPVRKSRRPPKAAR